jgi:hypothetical protein
MYAIFYAINCPIVICLPSMLLFIVWRDTTSELWTPVKFPLHCYYRFTIYLLIYILAYYYLLPLNTLNSLFTANRWDWQPHRKLGQSSWLCCVQVPCCCWWKATCRQAFIWRHCPECRKASEHQPSEVWLSPTGPIKPWFHNWGKLAAVLLIPSSCGSQLVLNMHYQSYAFMFCYSMRAKMNNTLLCFLYDSNKQLTFNALLLMIFYLYYISGCNMVAKFYG